MANLESSILYSVGQESNQPTCSNQGILWYLMTQSNNTPLAEYLSIKGGQMPEQHPGQTQHTSTLAMSNAAEAQTKKAAKVLPTSLHCHDCHGHHYLEREWWFIQEAQPYVHCVLQKDR